MLLQEEEDTHALLLFKSSFKIYPGGRVGVFSPSSLPPAVEVKVFTKYRYSDTAWHFYDSGNTWVSHLCSFHSPS